MIGPSFVLFLTVFVLFVDKDASSSPDSSVESKSLLLLDEEDPRSPVDTDIPFLGRGVFKSSIGGDAVLCRRTSFDEFRCVLCLDWIIRAATSAGVENDDAVREDMLKVVYDLVVKWYCDFRRERG